MYVAYDSVQNVLLYRELQKCGGGWIRRLYPTYSKQKLCVTVLLHRQMRLTQRKSEGKSTGFCCLLSKGCFAQNISVSAIQTSKKLVMVVQLFSWFPLSSRRWCEGSSRKSSRSHQHRRVLVVHFGQNIQILSKKI